MRHFSKILFSLMMAVGLVGCRPATTSTSSTSTPEPTSTSTTPTVLRVGMECAYAPNNWEESKASSTNLPIENNPGFYAEGYDVQIAKLIGEQLNAEIVIVKLAWDGLIQALNAGTIDMIIAGMMDTSERKQAIDFSKTYGIGETVYTIMTKKTSAYASKTTLNDFANASILGQKGTYLDTVIDQIPNVNHVSPVASIPNMVDRLIADTVDGIVVDTDSAAAYIQTYPELVMTEFAQGQGFTLDYTGACIGIRKQDTDLKEKLNAALLTIDDTTRQALMDEATQRMPQ